MHWGWAPVFLTLKRIRIVEDIMRKLNRIHRMRAMVLATCVVAAACSGDAAGPETPAELGGSWTLVRVRDKAMPALFVDGAGKMLRFDEGQLNLGASSTFDLAIAYTFQGSSVINGDEGTYARSGNKVDFTADDEDKFGGTVSGSRMVINRRVAGVTFEMEFARQ